MKKILVDLSHNEQIIAIPESIFPSEDVLIFFNSPTDDLRDLKKLQGFNPLFIGNPIPTTESELLFTPQEIYTIKEYVRHGGNLIVTSGARGDYNFEHELGSLRVFYNLTGVIQYHYSVLFHTHPQCYEQKKWNIVITKFPQHEIFAEFMENDKIIFGKSTYFTLDEKMDTEILLNSPTGTQKHSYLIKQKNHIKSVPLMVVRSYSQGKVITLGCSTIFKQDSVCGLNSASNLKFVQGIFRWALGEV